MVIGKGQRQQSPHKQPCRIVITNWLLSNSVVTAASSAAKPNVIEDMYGICFVGGKFEAGPALPS